jgi:hypothetical protein
MTPFLLGQPSAKHRWRLQCQAGRRYLLESRALDPERQRLLLVLPFMDEVSSFPAAPHDDQGMRPEGGGGGWLERSTP